MHFDPSAAHLGLPRPRPSAAAKPGVCADPVEWAVEAFNFHPDPIQAEVLRSPARDLMLCCTRQFGKSTITAIKALHFALLHPGSLILVAGPTTRQTAEWIQKTRVLLQRLDIRPGREEVGVGLRLPNKSRLVGLPGIARNVRSYSAASLLIFDEAAFIPNDVYEALNPILAVSQGAVWQMSTPNAQQGFFYEDWHRKDKSVTRIRVTAAECPRIPPEFLEVQRVRLGEAAFKREYMCEFPADADHLLTPEQVDALWDDTLEALNGGRALWR